MGLNVLFFINLLHSGCYGNLGIVKNILGCLFAVIRVCFYCIFYILILVMFRLLRERFFFVVFLEFFFMQEVQVVYFD